ncbi:hypothetical protein BKA83DRAFT_4120403 [Pisolithus microcarpus]|nr:hypothetical protein BKA83DRAFT_4120403 [Pisolithus microcarpus]
MYAMNKQSTHVSKHEMVSTSEADEIDLVNPILTTVKHMPHVLRLQVPTSIQNVTLSFELKSHGPVTIEISFTTTSPELMDVTDPSHTTTTMTTSAHDSMDTRTNGIKPEFVDFGLPALVELANEQPTLPCILVVHGAEPGKRTSSPIELTVVLESSPSPLPTHTPYQSLKCGFTPDSFAGSEDFDSVNTQLLSERWAHIQEELIAGQRHHQLVFSEVTNPIRSPKCLRN